MTAAEAGLPRADTAALAGGEPLVSAAIIEAVLRGTETGPPRDVVLLNSGAALVVAGRADTIRDGVALALATIASGAAIDQLERLRRAPSGPPPNVPGPPKPPRSPAAATAAPRHAGPATTPGSAA